MAGIPLPESRWLFRKLFRCHFFGPAATIDSALTGDLFPAFPGMQHKPEKLVGKKMTGKSRF
jgi:hypothetical protein